MGAVGLVFAPLAPLVAVAAAIVFWVFSWAYKYQLMFVFISKVESGGRVWNVVINRLLFSVVLMQALMILTIGLQYKFQSLQWLSTVPPVLFVVAFKLYLNRVFLPAFQFYMPTEEEIRLAKVHSERADNRGNRLEKRFGHPALVTDLFTPMLHATMMPLLSQVYHGKLGRDEAKLNEYGGQKQEAQVVPGGIKIAAISQNDLEYDPALYRRDRGELDWDARSVASTAIFNPASPYLAKSQYYASNTSLTRLTGYDRYLAGGGQVSQADIELSNIDHTQEPLLNQQSYDYFEHQVLASQRSFSPSIPPSIRQDHPLGSSREAPTHRPQEGTYSPYRSGSPAYSPEPQHHQVPTTSPQQQYHDSSYYPHSPWQDSTSNLAERGAHGR